MTVLILASSALVLVSVVIVAAVSVWMTCEHSLIRVTDVTNDNDEAITHFLAVLSHAERELLVHDDGDKAHGSLYEDEDTVEAVGERLRMCPNLKIRCLLNFNEGVKMAALSKDYGSRFQVRYLRQRPADDVHFKIADGGKMAYMSTHPKGAAKREGCVLEDIGARERTRKRRFGGLIDDFNQGFDKAHSE